MQHIDVKTDMKIKLVGEGVSPKLDVKTDM